MPTIEVKHEVSNQFLADVLTTAVESGGHALWYYEGFSLIDLQRAPETEPYINLDITPESVYRIEFACDHRDDGDPATQGQYVIDLEDIAKGIQWVLDGSVPVTPDLVGMIAQAVAEDDADIDALGADVIVQACAFKEIVFG